MSFRYVIFFLDVILNLLLLLGAVWSIAKPQRRIWPPPNRKSWQFWVTWFIFAAVFALNSLLMVTDWDSWIFHGNLRFILGIVLVLLGSSLVTWGIRTLGTINTSGIQDRFVKSGPYQFTRNPQYLGDNVLFIGLSIIANSELLWITHILLVLVFIVTPWAEEQWLGAQYGSEYSSYKASTPRFL